MAKLITKEQMAEQESYIMKLKEENMRYAAQNGHAKLALTKHTVVSRMKTTPNV